MDVLSEWSHKWMLKINNGKTKVVHFRKASTPATEYTFNIGDTVIERTDSYRYLGLHINDTLDFNFGVSILSQSSSRALGTIISKHFSVGGFPHEPYRRMYDTLVAPVMDYAAEVWGAKNYDQCNTVQHRAMRTFLGVSRCTPVAAMYGDMQWYTPYVRHQVSMIRYWLRLTRIPESRLTKRIFLWDHDNALSGTRNWNDDILNIFTKCNMQQHFPRSQWPGLAPDPIIRGVKRLLTGNECETRARAASEMSRLRLYNEIHQHRPQEPSMYLDKLLTRPQRSALAKFRMGTLPIAVETGRYIGKPEPERLCKSCNCNVIESQLHFLFECTHHNELRLYHGLTNLIDTELDLYINKLKDIFNDADELKRLSDFIITAMRNRVRWKAVPRKPWRLATLLSHFNI